MELKEYIETDDALFHYTSASIAIKYILNTKKFRLSILYDMNDPREYKFKLIESSHGRCSATTNLAERDTLFNDTRTAFNRMLRRECKVMCFCSNVKPTLILSDRSSKEDEYFCPNGWAKSRMWSQYGDNHYGICLILSKKELVKDLEKAPLTKYMAEYVKYFQKESDYPSFDSSALVRSVEDCVSKYVIDNLEVFLFHKYIDYRDEAEFRVVVPDPDQKFEYLDISTSLKGVIVGDRTETLYNIDLIKRMCKGLEIECRQAHWSTSSPHMLLK